MSNDNFRTLQQKDAFAAIQQMLSQSPSIAALQLQLAQGQLRMGGSSAVAAPLLGEQHLIFSLAGRDLAIKAELVQGVDRPTDITPVPNVVSWVRGVINLRGSIASVVDLRMFLDLEQSSQGSRTRLLSLQYNEMVICFVVDAVSEMMPVSANAIVSNNARQADVPPWALPYASGTVLLAGRAVIVLDVPRLLFSEKMQRYTV